MEHEITDIIDYFKGLDWFIGEDESDGCQDEYIGIRNQFIAAYCNEEEQRSKILEIEIRINRLVVS